MIWLGTAATIVALVSGVIGMMLGIYNFVDSWRSKQRRIRVKIDDTGFIVQTKTRFVSVTAANTGFRSVTLQEAGVFLPNGHKLTVAVPKYGVRFPHVLSSGESCNFLMDAEELARTIQKAGYGAGVQLLGYYRDALDTLYRSKPLTFNPDRFASPPQS